MKSQGNLFTTKNTKRKKVVRHIPPVDWTSSWYQVLPELKGWSEALNVAIKEQVQEMPRCLKLPLKQSSTEQQRAILTSSRFYKMTLQCISHLAIHTVHYTLHYTSSATYSHKVHGDYFWYGARDWSPTFQMRSDDDWLYPLIHSGPNRYSMCEQHLNDVQ